jgi:hypothetical protein
MKPVIESSKLMDMVLDTINNHIKIFTSQHSEISIEDIKQIEDGGLIINNKVAQLDEYYIGQAVALARVYYSLNHTLAYYTNQSENIDYVKCEDCFRESKTCNCAIEEER